MPAVSFGLHVLDELGAAALAAFFGHVVDHLRCLSAVRFARAPLFGAARVPEPGLAASVLWTRRGGCAGSRTGSGGAPSRPSRPASLREKPPPPRTRPARRSRRPRLCRSRSPRRGRPGGSRTRTRACAAPSKTPVSEKIAPRAPENRAGPGRLPGPVQTRVGRAEAEPPLSTFLGTALPARGRRDPARARRRTRRRRRHRAAQRNGQRHEDRRARSGPRSGSGSTPRGRLRGGRSACERRERRLAYGFNARRGFCRFSIRGIQAWGSLPAAVSPAKPRVPFPFFSEPRASCARLFSESRDRPARELERTL